MNNQDKQIKFMFNQDQANFYKFMQIIKRYFLKQLNTNEYLNLQDNIKALYRGEPIENINIIDLITNQDKINQFIEFWEHYFVLYEAKN